MNLKFVEAGHSVDGGNWGKFALGRYTGAELTEPTQFPGCEGGRIVSLRGSGHHHLWIFDLATGEAVRFPIAHVQAFDAHHFLAEHRIWVCPLFEPFATWLFGYISAQRDTWWDTLPRIVELPDAPFALSGYRRPGSEHPGRRRVTD